MPELARREFWKELQPIPNSLKPDARPEVYIEDAPTEDERYYVPFAYTISGKWGYLEHGWTARAGDFVYETPGEGHTLVAYDYDEPMRVFFIVKGPLIWLDQDGNAAGYFDVHDYIKLCREHFERVGIGADYVDTLFR